MKMRIRFVVAFTLLLALGGLLSGCATQQQSTNILSGPCIGVTDGDTVVVLIDNNEIKVRLWGIDCPESNQAFGKKAKQFTSSMVYRQFIRVEDMGKDNYGRTLGWITTKDGSVLNLELVKAGYAWWYEKYAPLRGDIKQAQQEAKTAKRGLWADKNPIAPWEFRSQQKSKSRLKH